MTAVDWRVALVGATALHAGFQLAVSVVVYPALAATTPEGWRSVHDAHSRRIAPLVGVVYAVALVAVVGSVLTDPGPAVLLATLATGAAMALTAALAAPLHGRLGRVDRPDTDLLRQLLLVDRLRAVAAVLALVAAVAAVT